MPILISLGLFILARVLDVLSGGFQSVLFTGALVILTAAWAGVDASHLRMKERGYEGGVAITLFVLVLWFVAFPFYLYRRRKVKRLLAAKAAAEAIDKTTKNCPFCGEQIKREAIVCRFCRSDVGSPPSGIDTSSSIDTPERNPAPNDTAGARLRRTVLIALAIGVIAVPLWIDYRSVQPVIQGMASSRATSAAGSVTSAPLASKPSERRSEKPYPRTNTVPASLEAWRKGISAEDAATSRDRWSSYLDDAVHHTAAGLSPACVAIVSTQATNAWSFDRAQTPIFEDVDSQTPPAVLRRWIQFVDAQYNSVPGTNQLLESTSRIYLTNDVARMKELVAQDVDLVQEAIASAKGRLQARVTGDIEGFVKGTPECEQQLTKHASVVSPGAPIAVPVAVPDAAPGAAPGAAPAPTSTPIRVDDPSMLRQTVTTPPMYPSAARAARVEGVVVIDTTIGPDGKVKDMAILRHGPLEALDQSALDAVRQWQFTPTLVDGKPVPVIVALTVTFSLK